jgi:hypothetical protein
LHAHRTQREIRGNQANSPRQEEPAVFGDRGRYHSCLATEYFDSLSYQPESRLGLDLASIPSAKSSIIYSHGEA